ncbi:MAG: hypothetical protein HQ567_05040, partial [Candidatus Nealsonbacteria bacterium]|nr:hypothetical protein [Candidatus Nealsonbacteria bacterium]
IQNDDTAVLTLAIFYNHSTFDDPAEGRTDDDAIATDKTPLLPGDIATKANYTSYSRGINGIMVDIAGLANPDSVTIANLQDYFAFHVGNDDNPGSWPEGPAPDAATIRQSPDTPDADRVTITWPDNAIRNTWLQVTVKAANLGLADDDVFYFGNAVAEAGNSGDNATVTTADLLLARNNPRNLISSPADVTFPYDFDRDGRVDAVDVLLARNNQTSFFNALKLIDLSGEGEAAPESPLAELAWLTDLDQPATQRSVQKDVAAEAVDLLLATLWS